MPQELSIQVFAIHSESDFESTALTVFNYQYQNNEVYHRYCQLLKIDPNEVSRIGDIPFLPISFFKTHRVISGELREQMVFTSSGTTGTETSKHFVSDLSLYEQSFRKGFELTYGDTHNYCILALLPSYLERTGSSLVYMASDLIKQSKNSSSGFYLHNYEELSQVIDQLEKNEQKTILLGVTYALLDFAEAFPKKLKHTIVMETGGMKGKRKELIKTEVHELLKSKLGIEKVHSEYGMTELLSQAYSKGDGLFTCPSWMKILIRDVNDPLTLVKKEHTGGINVIDLANINSCSFIATQDLGRLYADDSFEVLGRFDNSDIRGCNLLVD